MATASTGTDGKVLQKVKQQIEFYFSDSNFRKDKFLRGIAERNDGYVEVSIILTFARMKQLTTDSAVVFEALAGSDVIEVDVERLRLKRMHPLPEDDDSPQRTVFCKGIPEDATLEQLQDVFASSIDKSRVLSVRMRRNQEKSFNGTCFVEYASVASAMKATEEGTSFILAGTKLGPLCSLESYLSKSKREGEKGRIAKAGAGEPREFDPKSITLGLILSFEVQSESEKESSEAVDPISREDIKTLFEGTSAEATIAYVDFQRGSSSGFVRMTSAEGGEAVMKLVGEGARVRGFMISTSLLSGETEMEYWRALHKKQEEHRNKHRRDGNGNGRRRNRMQKRPRDRQGGRHTKAAKSD